ALLGDDPLGLAQRDRLRLRVPALSQVPEPLAAAPPDDGDVAVHMEGLQHQADVPAPVPPVVEPLVARPVLEVAREQRAAPFELAEHVAAKRRVLLQELA